MKIVPVDPKDFPDVREAHRGRVSYPIIKSFMEANTPLAKLDRTGMQQSLQGLSSALGTYIRSHNLPIKLFTRAGEIYLMRRDLNSDGTPNPGWNTPQNGGAEIPNLSPGLAEEKVASGKHGS